MDIYNKVIHKNLQKNTLCFYFGKECSFQRSWKHSIFLGTFANWLYLLFDWMSKDSGNKVGDFVSEPSQVLLCHVHR